MSRKKNSGGSGQVGWFGFLARTKEMRFFLQFVALVRFRRSAAAEAERKGKGNYRSKSKRRKLNELVSHLPLSVVRRLSYRFRSGSKTRNGESSVVVLFRNDSLLYQ